VWHESPDTADWRTERIGEMHPPQLRGRGTEAALLPARLALLAFSRRDASRGRAIALLASLARLHRNRAASSAGSIASAIVGEYT